MWIRQCLATIENNQTQVMSTAAQRSPTVRQSKLWKRVREREKVEERIRVEERVKTKEKEKEMVEEKGALEEQVMDSLLVARAKAKASRTGVQFQNFLCSQYSIALTFRSSERAGRKAVLDIHV